MKRNKLKKIFAYKTKYLNLLQAVHLKWAESNGYFVDGYVQSSDSQDPLCQYYPTFAQYVSLLRTTEFRTRKREAFSRG